MMSMREIILMMMIVRGGGESIRENVGKRGEGQEFEE